jgi:SAM-dependent methyltransferase
MVYKLTPERRLMALWASKPSGAPASVADLFDRHVRDLKHQASSADFDENYYLKHRKRFVRTADFIPAAADSSARALEVGATDLFQIALKHLYGYADVAGTLFSPHIHEKRFHRTISVGGYTSEHLSISIDLENDILPFTDATFDFILCCEVIEHLDIDPMFMLSEFNRVLKPDGQLLITTPNCCSARNFWKIAHGYRPHFFMQYERSRSRYRHNIEYDVHSIAQLAQAAGFAPVSIETEDVFEETLSKALDLLKHCGLTTDHRGDDIFARVRKVSSVVDRWPDGIYV